MDIFLPDHLHYGQHHLAYEEKLHKKRHRLPEKLLVYPKLALKLVPVVLLRKVKPRLFWLLRIASQTIDVAHLNYYYN
jgi:hypothetical protein